VRRSPIGAILAGGLGRRIGGDKAKVGLAGRPLLAYPVETLGAVLDDVVVVAREDSALPPLGGVHEVWIEPDGPRHPLAGVIHALAAARGRPVVVLAGDLPLVTPAVVRALVRGGAAEARAAAVVPRAGGRLQPLAALYTRRALPHFLRCPADVAMRDAVGALLPRVVEVGDEEQFLNVNAPEDLLLAGAVLDRRWAP
jgi:molybdenum cofactor guanylyltransferase